MLQKPSNFDSTKKYPVLVTVYGGPATNGARETFTTPSPLTEYGFIVLSIDSRSAAGRGKRFLDAIYQKLGTVEIDDQAEGVKALWDRPYIDRNRVGIFGTSYGGYASGLALLRHPDVFAAASSSSPVTDWRHYDSIYTERYMWLPDENKAGYDAGLAHDVRRQAQGPADAVLRDGGQQRAPVEHDAAHHVAAALRQELRCAGRSGPRALGDQHRSHDGVLHRESRHAESGHCYGVLSSPRKSTANHSMAL